MHWEKKICIRITTRRIIGAILMASTVVNLVIVGAAFEAAAPSSTLTVNSVMTTHLSTTTLSITTAASGERFTLTSTQGPSPASTYMFTPTDTPLDPPRWIPCIKRFYWSNYLVQPGDTLSTLAVATRSTAEELKQANCLADDRINYGQILYVPRLPSKTSTPSSTLTDTPSNTPTDTASATPMTITPSVTPTYTPTPTATYSVTPITVTPSPTPTNPPTVFQDPQGDVLLCPSPDTIHLSVLPYDPQGIRSLTAVYRINGGPWVEISMGPDGDTYYGSGSVSGDYATVDIVDFYFIAVDTFEDVIASSIYNAYLIDCPPVPLSKSVGSQIS